MLSETLQFSTVISLNPMDLASSLVYHICWPTGAFAEIPDASNTSEGSSLKARENANTSPESWRISPLNPQYRVNSFQPVQSAKWRIDGVDNQGIEFLAVPVFMIPQLVPRRIDVHIPDQTKHPRELRATLDSDLAFCLRDSRVAELGIARLVVQALEIWTTKQENFSKAFHDLPYGSRIAILNICSNPEDMQIRMIPDFTTERQLLSMKSLESMWKLPTTAWPESLNLNQLQQYAQLHDTVSLVKIPSINEHEFYIFKSTIHGIKHLYHELKLLLTMSPHPNVMPRPLYIVTDKDRYGGDDKVYGFVLRYYPLGTLADTLASRADNGTLDLGSQFHWAKEITTTLMAINESPAMFHSELKPDNLLLYTDADGLEHVLFIDFEQMGNWTTFSAPEIHYVEYVARLSKSDRIPAEEKMRFNKMLEHHLPAVKDDPADTETYSNPPQGYYKAWTSLSALEREAAEVFSLGKTLWSIFEGCADTKNSPLKAFKYDTGQEYPEYRKTPSQIQDLIRDCTSGERDYVRNGSETGIIRIGSKIYPRPFKGVNGEPEPSEYEARKATKLWWQNVVKDMELYLAAKLRWKNGTHTEEDVENLGFPKRPRLTEVLSRLAAADASLQ
jgi:hypothetical protein